MSHPLLIVEDDAAGRRSIVDSLLDDPLEVHAVGPAERALARVGELQPDAVLSDVRMTGMDGIELLKTLRERAPEIDVVLMTAYEDMPTVARAMRDGAFDFLVKPLKLKDLRAVLGRLFADREARERSPSTSDADS